VLFDGKRASASNCPGRATHQATRAAEVILAAGAIGSPQFLQCSGVGAAELLQGGRAGVA
jgi:choline dehydrogenase